MSTDFPTLSAAALLAIPDDCPGRLFTGSADDVKRHYRRLAMAWHPDRNRDPSAPAVFQHIRRLYEMTACRGPLTLAASDGKTYELDVLRRHPFELGTMYVANTVVAFAVDRAHADLVRRAERMIGNLRYADDDMRRQIAGHLPACPFVGAFETDSAYVVVMRKRSDLLLLRDVLDHFGGRLDPHHVAWVVSSLLNLCCYLHYAGITHNALSVDTCFMSPSEHSVAILGGWWYAADTGARMAAAPSGTIEWAAHDLLDIGRADIRTDLELVRATGRALLGDISGMRLVRDSSAPRAMIDWLRLPASDDPIEEYRTWRTRVLHDSFGARRFVELPLTQSDIYR